MRDTIAHGSAPLKPPRHRSPSWDERHARGVAVASRRRRRRAPRRAHRVQRPYVARARRRPHRHRGAARRLPRSAAQRARRLVAQSGPQPLPRRQRRPPRHGGLARRQAPRPPRRQNAGVEHLGVYVDPPDWACEVLSETTRRRDEPGGVKWRTYWEAGVAHYWPRRPHRAPGDGLHPRREGLRTRRHRRRVRGEALWPLHGSELRREPALRPRRGRPRPLTGGAPSDKTPTPAARWSSCASVYTVRRGPPPAAWPSADDPDQDARPWVSSPPSRRVASPWRPSASPAAHRPEDAMSPSSRWPSPGGRATALESTAPPSPTPRASPGSRAPRRRHLRRRPRAATALRVAHAASVGVLLAFASLLALALPLRADTIRRALAPRCSSARPARWACGRRSATSRRARPPARSPRRGLAVALLYAHAVPALRPARPRASSPRPRRRRSPSRSRWSPSRAAGSRRCSSSRWASPRRSPASPSAPAPSRSSTPPARAPHVAGALGSSLAPPSRPRPDAGARPSARSPCSSRGPGSSASSRPTALPPRRLRQDRPGPPPRRRLADLATAVLDLLRLASRNLRAPAALWCSTAASRSASTSMAHRDEKPVSRSRASARSCHSSARGPARSSPTRCGPTR